MTNSAGDLLDASAVLAVLEQEPGSEVLAEIVPGGEISAVNLAEAVAKLVSRGMPKAAAMGAMAALDLRVVPFGEAEAFESADFVHPGMSLGDRACLGSCQASGRRAITGEERWLEIRRGVDVFLFRKRSIRKRNKS